MNIQTPLVDEPKHGVKDAGEKLFHLDHTLHELKHYLPAQAPLKDFIHHNTLHAFQKLKYHNALQSASEMFGYKTTLALEEYRRLYNTKKISDSILQKVVKEHKGEALQHEWVKRARFKEYQNDALPRIGKVRSNWKTQYQIDMDSIVHPLLFRVLCSYLDQGISIWNFPILNKDFIAALRDIERNSFTSFFRTSRAKRLLLDKTADVEELLVMLVGNESLFSQYLFDQQFAHQGWSGIVSVIEDHPETLLDHKKISLRDLIHLELLLEIDALDYYFGESWLPLSYKIKSRPADLFEPVNANELSEVMAIWQEAFEWSYYDQVIAGLRLHGENNKRDSKKKFQAMFCIDDREFSLQYYLEKNEPACETFGTPGFFNVEFFYQPEHGKFFTKLCPAPVTPKYLIREVGSKGKREKDVHYSKHSHTLLWGWFITQTLGFMAAFKLLLNIFRPSKSPASVSSFSHMDKSSRLTIENNDPQHREKGLQVGFTTEEMALRVEGLLRSIGLINHFAPVVYVVGHGSSSSNNPHYAAYDCGACSGRPGSVNARVFSFMANHPKVRETLRTRGIDIPDYCQFLGGLHDTSRDEVTFFDEDVLTPSNQAIHRENQNIFKLALQENSKERSRRFELMDPKKTAAKIHEEIKLRSVSLFEPRPELNHATNALCIVGRRNLTRNLFLDRRAFLNSYDYRVDPTGKYLFNILKAAAPVCGGINLEYLFSRVDNQKLGAGTKLPHNVMGLFGVANGIDGDLRPGLPSQMIEVHDPIRLLIIVEHFPEVVLQTIKQHSETYEWFINEWVHLVVQDPVSKAFYRFENGVFNKYNIINETVEKISEVTSLIESHRENIAVHLIA